MRPSNNKILFIVLIVLAGGFVLTRVFRTPALERNIHETLLTLDTSEVNAIHVAPAIQEKMQIRLIRSGNDWQVQMDERNAHSEKSVVQNVLGSLASIHADRVLTRKKEKWNSYHVDTTGTHVKVFVGEDEVKEFWLGKMEGGKTCIRIEGESDVYAIEEMLEGKFNKTFNEWRDRTLLNVKPENISKITLQYPGDSSFIIHRSSGRWEIDNAKADSSNVQNYLNRFKSRELRDFADDFTPPGQPSYTVILQGDSTNVITVKGWKVQDDRWVLNSNQQADVYFSSDTSLVRDLFVGKKWFLSKR